MVPRRRNYAAAVLLLSASALRCGGKSSDVHQTSHAGTGTGDGAGTGGGSAATGGSTNDGGRATSAGGSNTAGERAGNAGRAAGTGGMSGSGGTHVADAGRSSGGAGRAAAGKGGAGGGNSTGGQATAGNSTGGGAGEGTSGAGSDCDLGTDCPGGTCWTELDGYSECVNPPKSPTPAECFGTEPDCCTADTDCTEGTRGRCIPRVDTVLSCGGAFPAGNSCNYDACSDDVDCVAAKPADTSVATCLPAGALGGYTSTCAYGVCRTDRDCTAGPDGHCVYDLAATHNGACDLRYVLFCAYADDPCTERYGSCADTSQVCAPNDDFQGRHCVDAPPRYP